MATFRKELLAAIKALLVVFHKYMVLFSIAQFALLCTWLIDGCLTFSRVRNRRRAGNKRRAFNKAVGPEKKSKINKRRAYIYSGLY